MSPEAIASIIEPAIETHQVLLVTYQHKKTGIISTHSVVPYSVQPGARSKSGKPMFWGFCLDHGHIEQRIPDNVISIDMGQGNFDDAPPNPFGNPDVGSLNA